MKKEIKIEKLTDKKILDLLDKERSKYMVSNKEQMKTLVNELVKRKVYPPITRSMKKRKMTVLKMVECYGANWHIYSGKLNCPHCNEDLRDLVNGAPFKREIGIYDMGEDRTVESMCPKCFKGLSDGKVYFYSLPLAKKNKGKKK